MKKLLLFVLTLACFASFAEESRLERCLRIINERFAEEQETVEYIEAKKELVNSKDVKAIYGMGLNKMASQKTYGSLKNKPGDK